MSMCVENTIRGGASVVAITLKRSGSDFLSLNAITKSLEMIRKILTNRLFIASHRRNVYQFSR